MSRDSFLRRRDEASQRAGLADDRREFGGGFGKDADFFRLEHARVHGLDHEHALQHPAIDDRDAEEATGNASSRGFAEKFVTRDERRRDRPRLEAALLRQRVR